MPAGIAHIHGIGWLLHNLLASRRMSNECLNGEILETLKEAQVVIEQRRREYNTLGYKPLVPAANSPLVSTNQFSQPQAVM